MQDPTEKHVSDVGILDKYNNNYYYYYKSVTRVSRLKADFQSSHEAPRSSLRVHA